jgi:peptidoglycan hydrolase-like protein with peptidoglycan-binding domain
MLRDEVRSGTEGNSVRELQEQLAALGYYGGRVDGDFGPITHEAVRAFQEAAGLTPDGIVGERTWDVLEEWTGEPKPDVDRGGVQIDWDAFPWTKSLAEWAGDGSEDSARTYLAGIGIGPGGFLDDPCDDELLTLVLAVATAAAAAAALTGALIFAEVPPAAATVVPLGVAFVGAFGAVLAGWDAYYDCMIEQNLSKEEAERARQAMKQLQEEVERLSREVQEMQRRSGP